MHILSLGAAQVHSVRRHGYLRRIEFNGSYRIPRYLMDTGYVVVCVLIVEWRHSEVVSVGADDSVVVHPHTSLKSTFELSRQNDSSAFCIHVAESVLHFAF